MARDYTQLPPPPTDTTGDKLDGYSGVGAGGATVTANAAVLVDTTLTPYTPTTPADTQPVSGTVTVQDGGGSLTVDGPLTDAQLRAVAVPVSGTFYPATQPVSGEMALDAATLAALETVNVGNLPATQPVSGTVTANAGTGPFPVSDNGGSLTVDGPLTDAQLRATAVPVSGTVSVNALPAGTANIGDVDVLTLPALPAGTNNIGDVDVLSLPALPAGANNIGDVDVLTLPAGTVAGAASLPAGTNNIGDVDVLTLPALTAGTNRIGSVRPVDSADADLSAAKGAQTARFLGTQDAKDSGRAIKVWSATFTAATTEALVTLTPITDGAAGSTGTSFTVTSAKRLRLVSLSVNTRNAGAAGQGVVVNLRMTASGAVSASSPLVATVGAGTGLAVANIVGSDSVALDMELSGTMQFGISQIGTATAGNTVTLIGYEF